MKQPLRQSLRASPAHSEKSTASNYLSDQISSFLKRTDHVMEEWSAVGRKKGDTVSYIERQREQRSTDRNIGRSRSAANIAVRGFQLIKSQPSLRRSMSRDINEIPSDQIDDDDRTVCDEEVKLSLRNLLLRKLQESSRKLNRKESREIHLFRSTEIWFDVKKLQNETVKRISFAPPRKILQLK